MDQQNECKMEYNVCDGCGSKHEALDTKYNQAMNCSSSYQRSTGRVFGHYGSTVIDMQIWKFSEDIDVDYPNDANLCDVCIKKHIDNGTLIFLKDYI
jgi:hypothetical protein